MAKRIRQNYQRSSRWLKRRKKAKARTKANWAKFAEKKAGK